MIELFPHNQIAYDKVVEHFKDHDRACVVQPCGTGKSWIAFKLIEDNPTKNFLWMSPNRRIFEEQMLNAKRIHGAEFGNVDAMTYAYAGHRAEEFSETQPTNYDYVILDEFHHLAAEHWGAGAKAVIDACSDAKVLGLTATPVRSDNVDMVEQMFKGHLVSQMDLSEAMASGILKMPMYVIADYMLQSELEDVEERIVSSKNAGRNKEKLDDLFDKFRNEVENAANVEFVLSRHLKPGMKIAVFCRNTAHLDVLVSLADEWFSEVNDRVHTYKTHTNNPSGEKEYASFKADKSDALKVLYVVDQLNEGVHIKDLDAIVMCRPTKSLIVFTQQIGRAIEAGSDNTPLIIDLVDNLHEENFGYELADKVKGEMQIRNERGEQVVEKFNFEVVDYTVTSRHLMDEIVRLTGRMFLDDYVTEDVDELVARYVELCNVQTV